jgi:hypothetical protein
LTNESEVCSINIKYYGGYSGPTIYIRAVNIERDGEQYGTYYQAVRSYREQGKVKQEVVHLGEHSNVDDALSAWPEDVRRLRAIGRGSKADKLQAKLDRLRELSV